MDRKILKKYDALKEEQQDIARRIDRLSREMSELLHTQVSDTVSGTREDGTYGPIKIKGIPIAAYDSKRHLLQKHLKHYTEIEDYLKGMISEIEDFITQVPDPGIRTILRLKYIDGKTWREIGQHYGKAHQWAYNRVERFFKE